MEEININLVSRYIVTMVFVSQEGFFRNASGSDTGPVFGCVFGYRSGVGVPVLTRSDAWSQQTSRICLKLDWASGAPQDNRNIWNTLGITKKESQRSFSVK